MGFVQEFKDFAIKGNAVDMAVGIIVGVAFGKVVSSLVKDVIMPPIGVLTGGADFSEIKIKVKDAVMEGEKVLTEAVTVNIGQFINVVIDFLIVAFVIFMVVKVMTRMKKKEEAAPSAPPKTPEDVLLLREIRDSLKKG